MVRVICTQCGKEFSVYAGRAAIGGNFFCCRDCYHAWRRRNRIECACKYCGNKFIVSPSNSKRPFCSWECRCNWIAKQRPQVICAQCGKKFAVQPSKIKELNFCSNACVGQWRHENWKGKDAPQYKGPRIGICEECGKEFGSYNKAQRFCSKPCVSSWQSKYKVGPKAARWQGGKITVECATCGKPLERIRSEVEHRSERFFCNVKYRGKWMSKNMIGDKHPNWRGGWEYDYGPNWEEQRDKARKRDNHTCQVCGLSKADIGRNPDVHHIVPFREFGYVSMENDHYLQANQLTNLITLCSSCHQKANWDLLAFQPKLL